MLGVLVLEGTVVLVLVLAGAVVLEGTVVLGVVGLTVPPPVTPPGVVLPVPVSEREEGEEMLRCNGLIGRETTGERVTTCRVFHTDDRSLAWPGALENCKAQSRHKRSEEYTILRALSSCPSVHEALSGELPYNPPSNPYTPLRKRDTAL